MLSRSNAGSRCDAKVSAGRIYFGQFSYCEFSGASLPACPNTFLLFIPFLYAHFRLTHTRTHVHVSLSFSWLVVVRVFGVSLQADSFRSATVSLYECADVCVSVAVDYTECLKLQ